MVDSACRHLSTAPEDYNYVAIHLFEAVTI